MEKKEEKEITLEEKAIDIKGKKYVLVADRILHFNEKFEKGEISTKILSDITSDHIIIKAFVYPDGVKGRCFTGHSQATIGDGFINKTSALENAETSAVGRALAMMGIGVIESVASADEINKANGTEGKPTQSELVCSICGTKGAISYRKNKDGVIYCPNWQTHKQKGEKIAMMKEADFKDTFLNDAGEK
ncbi:MAG: hypothetical protein K9M15_02755 [Candidatus Marinimicrobia bacterium]|nr:hypothetical protein [Candidatus Neomarinimicrobiota bacterium]